MRPPPLLQLCGSGCIGSGRGALGDAAAALRFIAAVAGSHGDAGGGGAGAQKARGGGRGGGETALAKPVVAAVAAAERPVMARLSLGKGRKGRSKSTALSRHARTGSRTASATTCCASSAVWRVRRWSGWPSLPRALARAIAGPCRRPVAAALGGALRGGMAQADGELRWAACPSGQRAEFVAAAEAHVGEIRAWAVGLLPLGVQVRGARADVPSSRVGDCDAGIAAAEAHFESGWRRPVG